VNKNVIIRKQFSLIKRNCGMFLSNTSGKKATGSLDVKTKFHNKIGIRRINPLVNI
jgi:hypothetical protein